MMPRAKDETGVVLDSGPQDWQILQQDARGTARMALSGRWSTTQAHQRAQVVVRLVNEATLEPVTRSLEWSPAPTQTNGTWSATLADIPAGGLYRLETGLQLDDGAVEWSRRGDQRHHVGVGDLWVIAGQSNAAGYGKTPCFDPPELGIHLFHASGEWCLATHPLSDSTGTQYPANRETANGSHSPFLAFARRLKSALGHPIGLIPTALGGSPLSRWVRGDNGDLFENMLAYVRDAGGACRGMLWYQGESDVGPGQRDVYARKFGQMVHDFREHQCNPRLPVITAQLNRYVGEPYGRPLHEGWDALRETQRQLARTMTDVAVISTLDLGLSDIIHNDSKANLTIGERMAAAALGLVHGKDVKWRSPDLEQARLVRSDAIELEFLNVDTRLNFESNLAEQLPFAVRDSQGTVSVTSWRIHDRNRLTLELARPLASQATVTGAPTACPPSIVPTDLCGYLPMLAFTVPVQGTSS